MAEEQAEIAIIDLNSLIADYDGQLGRYMAETGHKDVLIQMLAEVDVAKKGQQRYLAAVAVTHSYRMAEPLADIAEQLVPEDAEGLFAWVPAHLFGSDDFSVYISEHALGENLANGLIGEIVREAAIEEALMSLQG